MNKFKKLLFGAMLCSVMSNVAALPFIAGTMDMAGSFYAIDASGAQTNDANSAVYIDFDFFGMDKFRVTDATGDFAGLETVNGDISTLGDIKDFQFDPFTASIADFWVVDSFSFELTNVVRTNNSSSFVDLIGTGIITAAGFTATDASWTFSGDTSGGGVFSWNATSVTNGTPVPEPGMLALLATGLISFGLRKKLK